MKLVLSRRASQDFDEIYQYGFSKFGEHQADKYAINLSSCLETISLNPEIGRFDTRVSPAIRRHEHLNHIICYDVIENEIIIVRILHKSMNFLRNFNAQ